MQLGLERMTQMLEYTQLPVEKLVAIHVAGTNGKGSVSTKIAKAFELSGYSVGLYTSPHISTFRERLQINGKMIAQEELIEIYNKVKIRLAGLPFKPTFFEFATLLCFFWFLERGVDVAVLEVGLGGRLDATNVCNSILQIITSIDFDHTEILGNTLEEIAQEKAGIIKPGGVVVVGPSVPPLHTTSPVVRVEKTPLRQYTTGFAEIFDYEEENQSIARAALQELVKVGYRLENTIEEALLQRPPCRFQEVKAGLILDVAHNPHGVMALCHRMEKQKQARKEKWEKWVACCGFSQGKDVEKIVQIIKPNVHSIYFMQADNERAMPVEELLRMYPEGTIKENGHDTLLAAMQEAERLQCPCVVFGSFYIMSSVRKIVGISAETDLQTVGEIWKCSSIYST
jgi:dihydrofolate synthase/folylpolyglutamate synthase